MKKTYISDVSGLMNPPTDGNVFTTLKIVEELSGELRKKVVEARIEAGIIKVVEPNAEFSSLAMDKARATGDLSVLSNADISLLALTLQFSQEGRKPIVLTDDYALQNILKILNIPVKPIFGRKIRELIIWKKVCSICGTKHPQSYKEKYCRKCGGVLTRKSYIKLGRLNEIEGSR